MDLERRRCEDEQDAWPASSLGVTSSFLDSGSLVFGVLFCGVVRGGCVCIGETEWCGVVWTNSVDK